jgi:hypothetical protein
MLVIYRYMLPVNGQKAWRVAASTGHGQVIRSLERGKNYPGSGSLQAVIMPETAAGISVYLVLANHPFFAGLAATDWCE